MGLQPIDLQVMYSQSNNVSKIAGGNTQAAQLSESMQQTKIVQQNMENATKVHETSGDRAQSAQVDSNGRNGNSFSGEQQSDKDDSRDREKNPFQGTLKEKYLGTIIDITR